MTGAGPIATMMWGLILLLAPLAAEGFAASSDIHGFKVVSRAADRLLLEVDYSYAGNFGDQVTLQAKLLRDGKPARYFECRPGKVSSGRHTSRIVLSMRDTGLKRSYTNQVQFNMVAAGGSFGNYALLSEVFSLKKRWLSQALGAPEQVSPAEGAVFNRYPRTTRVAWKPVKNAASYGVQVDCFGCCAKGQYCAEVGESWYVQTGIEATSFTFGFVGAQPGAWRVWAIDAEGKKGPPSPWRKFRYTR